MKLWRLKHKPSGLYFTPVRDLVTKTPEGRYLGRMKSNLSVKGKIYTNKKPSLKYIGMSFYNHLKGREDVFKLCKRIDIFSTSYALDRLALDKTVESDWEIEEVE